MVNVSSTGLITINGQASLNNQYPNTSFVVSENVNEYYAGTLNLSLPYTPTSEIFSTTLMLGERTLKIDGSDNGDYSHAIIFKWSNTPKAKRELIVNGATGSSLMLKSTSGAAVMIYSRDELGLKDVENVVIEDSLWGLLIENKQPNEINKSVVTIEGGNTFRIGNSVDNRAHQTRRAIFSKGINTIAIDTAQSINIEILGQENNEYGSGLITGTGLISLSSRNIVLSGYSLKNDKGYQESVAIQAISEFQDEGCNCNNLDNSIFKLKAVEGISLETNWGAIEATSSDEHYVSVELDAPTIQIMGAGQSTSSAERIIKRDEYSTIKAVAADQKATIEISGERIQIEYAQELESHEAQHDLFFAYNENASINLTGNEIFLNNETDGESSADLRNIAFADNKGKISITTGISKSGQIAGSSRINGNISARNEGKVDLTLSSGAIWKGAVADESFPHWSASAGKFEKSAESGEISVIGDSGATWIVKNYENRGIFSSAPIDSTLSMLKVANTATFNQPFVVDLTKEASTQRLNITTLEASQGSANFKLRLETDGQDNLIRDTILVKEATGKHGIYVDASQVAEEFEPGNSLREQWLVSDNSSTAEFALTNKNQKVDIGLYKYELTSELGESSIGGEEKAKYWYLKRSNDGELTPGGDSQLSLAGNHRFLHWTGLEDLRKRLGEVRYGAQDGGWVRLSAQNDRAEGTDGAGGIEQDYYGINIGFDRLTSVSEDRMWLLGGSLVYGNAEQETRKSGYGTGETDRYGLNLYATWAKANGLYADFVLSGDWFKQDVTTHANDISQKGNYDTWGVGLSVEVGKMFTTEDHDYSWGPWYRHWWFEPQLQLAYYYLNGADYQLSDRGIRVKIDDDDSLIGRAGVVLGTKWNMGDDYEEIDRRYAQLMIKIGAKHDFLGDYRISMNGQRFTKDIGSTTFYYGLGFDWQFNDRTRLYVQAEREDGVGYTKEYEVSAGMKYEF